MMDVFEGLSLSQERALKEELAKHVHAVWANWIMYMFSRSESFPFGGLTIKPEYVSRWSRQMSTDYDDLSSSEKESDRDIAERYMNVINEFFRELQGEQHD